jgi:anti-sigma factor RsiW
VTDHKHPTIDSLSAYVLEPGYAEHQPIRQHLFTCQRCRRQADRLTQLIRTAAFAYNQTTGPISSSQASDAMINNNVIEDLDTNMTSRISDFVEGNLTETETLELNTHFSQSKHDLKAALHYAAHSASMRESVPDTVENENVATTPVTDKSISESSSISHRLTVKLNNTVKQLLDWKSPTWISVPLTAVLVLSVAIGLLPYGKNTNSTSVQIAQYQDNPVVSFKKNNHQRPGIGFFATTPTSTEAFALNSLSLNADNTLTLAWPTITGAQQYTVTISTFTNQGLQPLLTETVSEEMVSFKDFKISTGRRYQWKISGTTNDQQSFSTDGGFVLN